MFINRNTYYMLIYMKKYISPLEKRFGGQTSIAVRRKELERFDASMKIHTDCKDRAEFIRYLLDMFEEIKDYNWKTFERLRSGAEPAAFFNRMLDWYEANMMANSKMREAG